MSLPKISPLECLDWWSQGMEKDAICKYSNPHVAKQPTWGQTIVPVTQECAGNYSIQFECSTDESKGIANFRIDGIWDTALICVGGQQLDKIYSLMIGTNSFDLLTGDKCIPFLKNHPICLSIVSSGKYKISYDIVTLADPAPKYEYVFTTHQYWHEKECTSVKLRFNHVITKLYVKLDKLVKSVGLFMHDEKVSDFIQLDDTTWLYEFPAQWCINLSRLDMLSVRFDTPANCDAWVESKQLLQIMSGMAGTAFSK